MGMGKEETGQSTTCIPGISPREDKGLGREEMEDDVVRGKLNQRRA